MKIRYGLLASFLACLLWVGQVGASDKQSFSVSTSIKPLSLIARQLLGDDIEIKQILPDSEDPHHQHLKFSQIKTLQSSGVIFWFGPGIEGGLTKLLKNREHAIELGEQLAMNDDEDLHIWLNPETAIKIASIMVNTLQQVQPEKRLEYQARLAEFEKAVRATDNQLKQQFQSAQKPAYISDHNAYSHFARHYHFSQLGSLHNEDGSQISIKAMAKLRQNDNVECVIVEPGETEASRVRLAKYWQAKVVTIDPLGGHIITSDTGYSELLGYIAGQFQKCLKNQ